MKAPLLAVMPGLLAIAGLFVVESNKPAEVPGGEPVNGLLLHLAANRDVVCPGDEVVFTTSLTNLTDQEIRLNLGTHEENCFEAGWYLRRVPEPVMGPGKDLELRPHSLDARMARFILLLREPAMKVIPPGESLVYQTKLKLTGETHALAFPIGDSDKQILDAPPGMQRFRVVYQSDNASMAKWEELRRGLFSPNQRVINISVTIPSDNTSKSSEWILQSGDIRGLWEMPDDPPLLPCWEGTIRSNDVILRIVTR